MKVKGKVRIGHKTKNLVKEIRPGEIAMIKHKNLDGIAASSLNKAKVKAVINLDDSMSGDYPNRGPQILLSNNIPLLDRVSNFVNNDLKNGEMIFVDGNYIFDSNKKIIGKGRIFTREVHKYLLEKAKLKMKDNLKSFIENTLSYAKNEKDEIISEIDLSKVKTSFKGRECLIVTRGINYENDLQAILDYIKAKKPILVGVDGGADALLEYGFEPDIVLGDMDSVSNEALIVAREVLIHAYPDGNAPGEKRLRDSNLNYKKIISRGTSEDLALLVAHQLESKNIIAIGTHTNLIDFFEKNRSGMASTFLTRLKVGDRLIDAKGINEFFQDKVYLYNMLLIVLAAIIPLTILILNSERLQIIFKLVDLRLIQGY